MIGRVLALAAFSLLVTSVPSANADHVWISRTESKGYIAVGGDLGSRAEQLIPNCSWNESIGENLGGTCFGVEALDVKLDLTVTDERFGSAVSVSAAWQNSSGARIGFLAFGCGGVSGLAVPAGATKLLVSVRQAFSLTGTCPTSFGSRGMITAVFSRPLKH